MNACLRQGCGSGSYRFFGNVKLYKQGKNILKIEVLHIFRWIFPFFQIKIIIQISEETWLLRKNVDAWIDSLSANRDPGSGSEFKILICWIRIRPKMDRIRNRGLRRTGMPDSTVASPTSASSANLLAVTKSTGKWSWGNNKINFHLHSRTLSTFFNTVPTVPVGTVCNKN